MDIRKASVDYMLKIIGSLSAKENVSNYLVMNFGLDKELADAYSSDAYDEISSAYHNDFKFEPKAVVELLKTREI